LTTHRALIPAALLGVVLAAGCSSSPATSGAPSAAGSASGAQQINVVLTNTGCVADRSSVPAGAYVFNIVNEGGDAVSEVELMNGETILGERENLTPGLSGTFTLELEAGTYALFCPGATTEKTDFIVTEGGAVSTGPASQIDQLLDQATADYDAYVRDQVAQLVTATKAFNDAVRAGDMDQAKTLYGPARLFYERIEPVAESFGDLDPQIDGREDDAESPEDFTGFHRLEKALWADQSLDGMTPIADKLDADVAKLNTLVATAEYQPAQLANGAAELLDEIGASKITGEEERYSRIDLLDFQGNLEGARKAFDLISPALVVVDPALNATLVAEFGAVETLLAQHKQRDGYVSYDDLTQEQTRDLAQAVNALAEPMSQVAAKLVG
jgi:iron uptake system component EfeO